MKKNIFMLIVFCCIYSFVNAQNTYKAFIKDNLNKEPLIGATAVLKGTTNGIGANTDGFVELKDVPDGTHIIQFTFVGYTILEVEVSFPNKNSIANIFLSPIAGELEELIVEGTRSNKSIANIPTRVEVLTEEIDEASSMDPSKIAHLITHSTGIQVQQTSATSNTANVRIQGLDGRYTQILKDGFPLFGGFSGSLSIMQIPPLDLRQVEYIKGGASTLYGGGAIAGLINLISKEPDHEETLLHLNASHIGAFDANAYVSRKVGKIGFSILGQRNTHRAFDADDDGFSDMPMLTKFNLNPKLTFYISNHSKLMLGATFTEESRRGGDMKLMKHEYVDSTHFYTEENYVNRVTTQLKFENKISNSFTYTLRNSINVFQRNLTIVPSRNLDEYRFAGQQLNTFSEFSTSLIKGKHLLISGVNFYSDQFDEDSLQSAVMRNENYKTLGAFLNYNVDFNKMISAEIGFRGDYVLDKKFYALPRIAFLFKWSEKLTTRVGGGMGYRNATIFNQEAELIAYKNVMPLDYKNIQAEQSFGGNFDIGYKTLIGDHFFINFNQMFFYTKLDNPLLLTSYQNDSSRFVFSNANGFTQSYGAETFFKFGFYDFVFFMGYTYTNATNHFNDKSSDLALTPNHSLKGDLLYSIPGKWRIGVDYEYKSKQRLSSGKFSKSYWTYGAIVEYTYRNFTFFGNVENFTDVRQTNWERLVSGNNATPQFTEVWAPLDGIVLNGGIKIRL